MLKEFDELIQLALIHGSDLSANQEFIAATNALRGLIERAEGDLIALDVEMLLADQSRQKPLLERVKMLKARVYDWQPVARSLPAESTFVLCATVDPDGETLAYFVGYYVRGIWYPLNNQLPAMVTHWCKFERQVDAPPSDEEITADVLSDLLLLVGVDCPADVVEDWTPGQIEQAREWAASDNDDVEVPARPKFLTGYGGHLDPATCPNCLIRMEFDKGQSSSRNEPEIGPVWFCDECGYEVPA